MSLLAGYDFALEFAQPLVSDLVVSELNLDGVQLRPPAEFLRPFTINIADRPVPGVFHSIIAGIDVDIGNPAGDTVIVVDLAFEQASIRSGPFQVCPLAGEVRLSIPLEITGGAVSRITANLPSSETTVTFDPASVLRIDDTLAPFGYDSAAVVSLMTEAFKAILSSAGPLPIGNQTFALAPGRQGSPDPLAFTEATLRCIYNADRTRQALVLLGTLLVEHQGQGNPADKTAAIPPNRNIALTLSPAAFRRLIFCPGIASTFGLPPGSSAPGVCGGGPHRLDSVTITDVTDRFATGAIEVDIAFENSGFCYTAKGAVTLALTPTVSAGAVAWKLTHDEPSISLTVPWYCYLAAFVVSPILGVIVAAFDLLADDLAAQIARSRIGNFTEKISISTGSHPFPLQQVSVSPEGITFAYTLLVQPPPAGQPVIRVSGSQTTLKSETVNEGADHFHHPLCDVDLGTNTWVEERRWLNSLVLVETTLYGLPISVGWELVGASGVPVPLQGSLGTEELLVESTYETGSATIKVQRTAKIDWSLAAGGAALLLANHPDDGNYTLRVLALATNCAGTLQRSLIHQIVFNGHVLNSRHFVASADALIHCILDRLTVVDLPTVLRRPMWPSRIDGLQLSKILLQLATSDDVDAEPLARALALAYRSELRDTLGRPTAGGRLPGEDPF
jgi:hypothetical protein